MELHNKKIFNKSAENTDRLLNIQSSPPLLVAAGRFPAA